MAKKDNDSYLETAAKLDAAKLEATLRIIPDLFFGLIIMEIF